MGQAGRKLDAFVQGPRVHHQHMGLRPLEALLVDLPATGVLPQAWQEPSLLALLLESQGHHHVGPFQGAVQVGIHFHWQQQPIAVGVGARAQHFLGQ